MARIKWNRICFPKNKGGVGVIDIKIKNKSLLAKWSWRFTLEREALWRKIIAAKYGSTMLQWRFRTSNTRDMSVVWKGIMENTKDPFVEKWMGIDSFRWEIGKGNKCLFWEDIWCGVRPLRVDFPRLFWLAKIKNGSVKDYSFLNCFKEVNWLDFFIRPLLDRELALLNWLKEIVCIKVLIPYVEDRLIWVHDNKREFSVKNYQS